MKPLRLLTFLFGLLLIGQTTALLLARRAEAASQLIVFTATDLTGTMFNPSHVYTVRPDGRSLRRLTTDAALIHVFPKWSPDGEWVTMSIITDFQHLYKVRVNGHAFQQLTQQLTSEWEAIWSPDGAWLAFLGQHEVTVDVYRIRPDGSDLQQLTNSPAPEREVTWSPDGQWLAFTVNDNGRRSLWLIRPDGSDQQILHQQVDEPYALVWSGDSRWLYYVVHRLNLSAIYRYDVATGQREALYAAAQYFQDVTPDPNQQWIAFIAQDFNYQFSAWRLNLATRTTEQIGPVAPAYVNLRYSPDGKWLLFLRSNQYEWHLYRMRPDGSNEERLTPNGLTVSSADWQPMIERGWNGGGLLMIGVGLMGLAWIQFLPKLKP